MNYIKRSAKHFGMTVEEYLDKINNNKRRCRVCKQWLDMSEFYKSEKDAGNKKYECKKCFMADVLSRKDKLQVERVRM